MCVRACMRACVRVFVSSGSGKSYTMMGSPSDKGVIPKLCDTIFERIHDKQVRWEYAMKGKVLRIFFLLLYNLLRPPLMFYLTMTLICGGNILIFSVIPHRSMTLGVQHHISYTFQHHLIISYIGGGNSFLIMVTPNIYTLVHAILAMCNTHINFFSRH